MYFLILRRDDFTGVEILQEVSVAALLKSIFILDQAKCCGEAGSNSILYAMASFIADYPTHAP